MGWTQNYAFLNKTWFCQIVSCKCMFVKHHYFLQLSYYPGSICCKTVSWKTMCKTWTNYQSLAIHDNKVREILFATKLIWTIQRLTYNLPSYSYVDHAFLSLFSFWSVNRSWILKHDTIKYLSCQIVCSRRRQITPVGPPKNISAPNNTDWATTIVFGAE